MFPVEQEFMDEDLAYQELVYFAPSKPTIELINELVRSELSNRFHPDTPGGQYIRRKIAYLRVEILRRAESYDKMLVGA